jgi:purine-binding chemotaxis protein CheW
MTQATLSPTESTASSAAEKAGKFLTFFLDAEEYGIEILTVREIIGLMPVTTVPQTPYYVRGIINLRGKIIPVVDLRQKFDMPTIEDTEETCVVVVQTGGILLGVVVDKVSEVVDIVATDIVDAPTLGDEINTDYLLGIGKQADRVTLLLDIENVFPSSELQGLNALG